MLKYKLILSGLEPWGTRDQCFQLEWTHFQSITALNLRRVEAIHKELLFLKIKSYMSNKEELELHSSPDHKQESRLSTCSLEVDDVLHVLKPNVCLLIMLSACYYKKVLGLVELNECSWGARACCDFPVLKKIMLARVYSYLKFSLLTVWCNTERCYATIHLPFCQCLYLETSQNSAEHELSDVWDVKEIWRYKHVTEN